MKLIVGLGNPGPEYQSTRHNVGFAVVEKLARELGVKDVGWERNEKHKAELYKVGDVLLVKPITFMNNSGVAVGSIVRFYKLAPSDVWVVHDDIDLPMGKIRIRSQGGSAGHHGIESIMAQLKSDDFTRFRLGIGRGKEVVRKVGDKRIQHKSIVDFVLARFTQSEAGSVKHLVKHGAEGVRMALMEGMDKAMNRYN